MVQDAQAIIPQLCKAALSIEREAVSAAVTLIDGVGAVAVAIATHIDVSFMQILSLFYLCACLLCIITFDLFIWNTLALSFNCIFLRKKFTEMISRIVFNVVTHLCAFNLVQRTFCDVWKRDHKCLVLSKKCKLKIGGNSHYAEPCFGILSFKRFFASIVFDI